ncbi:MAG: glycosyltransferase family 4 protein [Roseimicrobium sp.]
MPRVAYLYSRYPVVSQTFCDSEMLALEAMGFELEVISLNPPPDSFRHERLDRLRAEIHYPPCGDILDVKACAPEFSESLQPLIAAHEERYGSSYKPSIRARNAWHFAPLLRSLGVSHIHVHFANRATHTALFLKELGFTFSFTAHAQDFMVDLGSVELLREMVSKAEFVVTVSDFSKRLLCEMCGGFEDKVCRIYNGIELDDFPSAQPDHTGVFRVVSVGRLIEFKGFQHLIPAVALLKAHGINTEVRIIGDGPLRAELESQIAVSGLSREVMLLGPLSQEQIKRELADAQAFVLPSIVDSKGASDILPTVITEAMAARLPVVSTRVAGIPEMVLDGVTGLLVEAKDEVALAEALLLLATDAKRRCVMGVAGRARAEELFALSVTARVLGERLIAVASREVPRTTGEILSLVNTWDNSPGLAVLAKVSPRVLVHEIPNECLRDAPFEVLETFPDAVVLESLWLRRTVWRREIERLRGVIGDAMDGEAFYAHARRAVWMADTLPRRNVKLVHAHMAGAMPAVWLCKKLCGMRVSAAVEEAPSISRATLARLLPDFDFASVSDERLASMLSYRLDDVLKLKKSATHKVLKFGPLRFKVRSSPPASDAGGLVQNWFEKLATSIHA